MKEERVVCLGWSFGDSEGGGMSKVVTRPDYEAVKIMGWIGSGLTGWSLDLLRFRWKFESE